jgi:hypothetical protein
VLAGKFAAGTRALVTGVDLRNDDPIGRCTGPLRFTPDKPGLIAGQCRPRSRLQQLAGRVERGLIRRKGFDLRKAQHHSKVDLYRNKIEAGRQRSFKEPDGPDSFAESIVTYEVNNRFSAGAKLPHRRSRGRILPCIHPAR